ncbi:DUF7333 family protein [Natrialbaceae archaeon AArc-T1-2]|uniref:DUF7333 family protein n=1 Tax=Natrialbaceae archaeon AArc-T1-2 TaxID=3053904 RepID=UPI00255AE5CD|nr:hypothetical protein [Natrialbaceae archaeon AArc-T1-2]WIV66917.1 hypothetical protein QQ977_14685 [Natrialbaceae archaeon AArc-T1-2]
MELDLPKTVVAFVLVVAIGTGALLTMPMGMTTDTVLMMVTPSMVIFGLITLAIGVAHGQYRATN